MGYPEVLDELAWSYIAFLSPGDLSKLEKHFDTAAKGAMKPPRSCSETIGWEKLFVL